jgi:hypothetical protein
MAKFVRSPYWRETTRLAKAAFILSRIGIACCVLLLLTEIVVFFVFAGDRPTGVGALLGAVMMLLSGVMLKEAGCSGSASQSL